GVTCCEGRRIGFGFDPVGVGQLDVNAILSLRGHRGSWEFAGEVRGGSRSVSRGTEKEAKRQTQDRTKREHFNPLNSVHLATQIGVEFLACKDSVLVCVGAVEKD